MATSNKNKRARGRPKRSSFADGLDTRALPAAVNLLRQLDQVDFGTFESQLQPIANGFTTEEDPSTLLKECLKFLVLKKIARDEDATTLSPTDVIDAVWHQLLLNPRLYKNINDALGGEMIDHNPEGGRDVAARNERVSRTIDMYKFVFIASAGSVSSSIWKAPEELPLADDAVITIRINQFGKETAYKCRKTLRTMTLYYEVAKRMGVPMSSIRLFCNGESLLSGDTLGDVVNDGDVIDLFPEQVGC